MVWKALSTLQQGLTLMVMRIIVMACVTGPCSLVMHDSNSRSPKQFFQGGCLVWPNLVLQEGS